MFIQSYPLFFQNIGDYKNSFSLTLKDNIASRLFQVNEHFVVTRRPKIHHISDELIKQILYSTMGMWSQGIY